MQIDGISVIICCYNAANRIAPTLLALQEQVLFSLSCRWEVIIVDNASTDNTADVARRIWEQQPVTECRIVSEPRPGLMHARHRGLSEAKYDIVSFIDDDNWVASDWLTRIAGIFSANSKVGACGGRSEAVFETPPPEWFPLYENNFAVGRQMDKSGIIDQQKGFLWGAGLSFRKSLWETLLQQGFTNLTVGRQGKIISAGEDSELCYAFRLLGYSLYYDDELVLKHYMPAGRMNLAYLGKMARGFGSANLFLNCYRVLLMPRFILHPWWYEWAVAVKNMLVSTGKLFFVQAKEKKWALLFKRSYNRGYAYQLWHTKKNINTIVSGLRKQFNIHERKN